MKTSYLTQLNYWLTYFARLQLMSLPHPALASYSSHVHLTSQLQLTHTSNVANMKLNMVPSHGIHNPPETKCM